MPTAAKPVYRFGLSVQILLFVPGLWPAIEAEAQQTVAQGETPDSVQYSPGVQTYRQGPWLDEEAPGLSPKIFAPGLISTAGHYEMDLTFTRDGRECFVGRDGRMLVSRWEDEGWTSPEEAPFRFREYGAMALTTVDGSRMILSGRAGLAVSKKTEGAWTDPVVFMQGMGMSITDDGTVYTSWIHEPSGEWRLYRSRYVADRYTEPEEVPLSLYSEAAEVRLRSGATHPQIAPDESFVLFESRLAGGYGDTEYYISFRKSDGTWGEPVNLGAEINSSDQNARARLSPDGRYLFFNRYGDIYWVSAAYLERFRRED
jgi:hypothetical protein